jgi:RNA polymerase sigma factor (sigma-70 family)
MANAQTDTVLRHIRRLTGDGPTDRELLQRFLADRDEAAFATLVRRHAGLVWSVCRRILHQDQDAEDAWQATFLVLARNAGTVRKAEALASFLHGVAHRTALRARRSATTRRTHERQEKTMPRHAPQADVTWRELQALLDEEVRRLPEKYRAPFVLCCLEEKSRGEAARELGWNEGTLSSRLAQARKILQRRLTRRGVTLAALLTSASLSTVRAAPPAALLARTIPAALSYAVRRSTGVGGVSAAATALAEGVGKAMTLSKFNVAVLLLLLAGIGAAGAGWLADAAPASSLAVAATPADAVSPAVPSARNQQGLSVPVTGQVLDPDGKPLPGARIYAYVSYVLSGPGQEARHVRATTAADGRFRFTLDRAAFDRMEPDTAWDQVTVVAAASGYGPAWETFRRPDEAGALKLRLVKDNVPITGRVLDLEGRPIPGVAVRATAIELALHNNLDAWIQATRATKTPWNEASDGRLDLVVPILPRPEVTTDADGRFRLTGIGRDRIVTISLRGPTIAARDGETYVITRAVPSFHVPLNLRAPELGNLVFYGATADIAAAPTKPIVGTVRDKDTGRPLAGVTIQSQLMAAGGTLLRDSLQVTTDRNGHYRLLGMPKGKGNVIRVVAPADQPYLQSAADVPDTPGLLAVRVDFALKRGVWIHGRVTDGATGKPVRARVRYGAFRDNRQLGGLPGYDGSTVAATAADGSFRVLGLPGRGLLAVKAEEDRFLPSVGAEQIPAADKTFTNIEFIQSNPSFLTVEHHAFVPVNPAEDGKGAPCEVRLDPGKTVTGTILGPDSKPLDGVTVHDLKLAWTNPKPLPGPNFTATALDPRLPRRLYFLHRDKHLGAAVLVRGDEDKPLTVRLQPCGSVTGRILDATGKPVAGAMLYGQSEAKYMSVTTGRWWELYLSGRTDKEGRFRVENLIPGVTYHLPVGPQNHVLTLRPGQTQDLGDVRVGRGGG